MNIILYAHGGSGNHGCEAIARSTIKILKSAYADCEVLLGSMRGEDDAKYGLTSICKVQETAVYKHRDMNFWRAYLKMRFTHNYAAMDALPYLPLLKQSHDIKWAISIGGDNYCYGDASIYVELNKMFSKKRIKTVLWGCSIEPTMLEKSEVVEDMKRYAHIIARESLTYQALEKCGLKNISLCPDPAFLLDRKDLPLPQGFVENNTVAINISPMIINCEKGDNITLQNYMQLIQYIVDNTDMQVALLPHVVWSQNDDRLPLQFLYEKFGKTGRVVMVDDCNAEELKGYIARCRFVVAARTHASIAAYSTCVPTLVVGYSIKAKGIANDIFGTVDNYVIPVQELVESDMLSRRFAWFMEHEKEIKAHLDSFMPEYRKKAWKMVDILEC